MKCNLTVFAIASGLTVASAAMAGGTKVSDPKPKLAVFVRDSALWIHEFDLNGDGKLSFDEFKRSNPSEVNISDTVLMKVFRSYDVDDDGFISVADMTRFAKRALAGHRPTITIDAH